MHQHMQGASSGEWEGCRDCTTVKQQQRHHPFAGDTAWDHLWRALGHWPWTTRALSRGFNSCWVWGAAWAWVDFQVKLFFLHISKLSQGCLYHTLLVSRAGLSPGMPCAIWGGTGKQNNGCKPARDCCKLQLEWDAQEAGSSRRDESLE